MGDNKIWLRFNGLINENGVSAIKLPYVSPWNDRIILEEKGNMQRMQCTMQETVNQGKSGRGGGAGVGVSSLLAGRNDVLTC